MKPVRVLVVDDSAAMRGLIASTLSRDPGLAVVGEAADPLQAREAIKQLDPDVMTLDVEMPRMDGLDFLEKVMRLRPMPVVMVSSLTARSASVAIRAMELGAVDCVGKPSIEQPATFAGLPEIVKAAASARLERRPAVHAPAVRAAASYAPDGKVVAIGASTGGVEALIEIVSRFPANCPPTLIALHMPSPFTQSFARRLDGLTGARVVEAEDGAPIGPGVVHVARGGMQLEIAGAGALRCRMRRTDPVNGHRPSVDVLFGSVAKACGARAVGVILTGMGRDGAAGLMEMRAGGARTLGQNERTALVYGMPKAAFDCGAVEKEASLPDIAREILALTSVKAGRNA